MHASQDASPNYRPADGSLPAKRKRGRPKREDPKNVSTAPLLPYPPPPLATHPLQAPVFIRPHPPPILPLPPLEARSNSHVPQSRVSAQSPSQSSAGSPAPHSAHLQHQEDSSQHKRKRGRAKLPDSNVGAIDPSLSNAPIVLNHQALRDPDGPATVQPTSVSLSGDDAPQSSRAQGSSPRLKHIALKEPHAAASTFQSTHISTSLEEGGQTTIVDLSNSNTTSPQPGKTLLEEHTPSALDRTSPTDHTTPEPPTSAQPDQEAGQSYKVSQPQETDNQSLSQKKKPGRPRKSVTDSQTPHPQIKSQLGNPPGFAENDSENAQSHNNNSAMPQKRPRGRPKKLDPRTEDASPLPLRPPPEKLSEALLSSEDEGETPDPLSFDALIRTDAQSDFSPESSLVENNEQLDSDSEHSPKPDLEHAVSTKKKTRGRPRKSGPVNPNPALSLRVSSVPDEEEHLEITQTREIQMLQSKGDQGSLTGTAQVLRSKETKVIQTKKIIQVKESSPDEEGPTGSQPEIEDDFMPPKKRRGRPKKSSDKVVPAWAAQPEESADSPQIPESSLGPQEHDNVNPISLKKSRGRPRKSAFPKELDPSAQVPETPRSPSADQSQASESADEDILLPPAKKSRGRPRKSEPIVRMVPSWGTRQKGLQNPPPPVGASPQIVPSPAPGTPLLMKKGPGRPRKVDSTSGVALSPLKMQTPPDDDDVVEKSQDAMQLDTPTQSLKKRRGRPRRSDATNGVALTPLRKKSQPEEHDSGSPPPQSPAPEDPPQEPKKRRGRPSKAAMEEQRVNEAANQELHPGTSISPKPQTREVTQSPEPAAGSSVSKKRRRGRPSKADISTIEIEKTTQAEDGDAISMAVPANKRPGRPKKSIGGNPAASGQGGDAESCVVQ